MLPSIPAAPTAEALAAKPMVATAIPPLCVRIPAAARLLGIGRTKTYELINASELETIKVGQTVLITMKSLEAFVDRRAAPGKPR